MELSIDVSNPKTLQFYIYAQKKSTPSVFAFTTNQAIVRIICGNEQVSVTIPQFQDLGSFVPTATLMKFGDFGSSFYSNLEGCPVNTLKLCDD
jgi:hypothetical protein